jgi:formate dehydrogenase major subunit
VTLPGEARQDWELIVALAKRLGLDWRYAGVPDVYTEMASVMPSLANIPWSRIEREDAVTYPADAENKPGNEILFAERFPTKDGRGRLVPADLLPPAEIPDDEFPLILTTGRLLEHWHTGSMTRRAGVLDALEPEAMVAMNPHEIRRRGLTAGAPVTVETRRGALTCMLRSDRDVADGMVFAPFCFAEAPANVLTNPQLDPIGKIPEFKVAAARVRAAG